MKKIIIIIGVLTTTSCGMFTELTYEQKERRNKFQYLLDKAYLDFTVKQDSLILEYNYKR